jgi:hypothetical protein
MPRTTTEYRGWKIEPHEGVQLGYRTGKGSRARPGKGRKVKGYRLTYAPDNREKIVATIEEARTYIDTYMGPVTSPKEEAEEMAPSEPEEGDITTEDHTRWFQDGRLYFEGDEAGLKARMDADKFWPNVWFISDHGNAHLITK